MADIEIERCFICEVAFADGELVLNDASGGTGHRACFGEDRGGYCDLETGEPLTPDEPIPEGYPYKLETSPAEAVRRLPTRDEVREAASLILRCNGWDLTQWGGDGLHDDSAQDALKALAAIETPIPSTAA